MKYKVGDKVRMSVKGKIRFSDSSDNPHNLSGKFVSDDGSDFLPIKIEWENGQRNSYDLSDIEPYTPPHQIEVGGKYTSRDGETWECIFVRDGVAWLIHGNTATYRWNVDGTPICLRTNDGYRIDLGTKVETIRVNGSIDTSSSGGWISFHSDVGKHKFTMEVTTLDGVPDWSTAKIEPA